MSLSMTPNALPDPDYDAAFYDGVLPKRFFAWMIDVALILVVMVLLSVMTVGIAFLLWVPVHLTLSFLYRWMTISNASATFGMRIMNIELRARDGARLTPNQAAGHTLAYLVSASFVLIQLISIALMIGRPMNRGLPDELVGSVMINRPG